MSKAFFDENSGRIIVKGIKVKPGQMDMKFRNFKGAESDKNRAGSRNFCVVISEEDKDMLEAAIKKAGLQLTIKEYNGEYYFKVLVRYDNFPPVVKRVKYAPNGQPIITEITEDTVGMLDSLLIADASVSCAPTYVSKYKTWSCYLTTLSFTPLVDPIEEELEEMSYGNAGEVPFE